MAPKKRKELTPYQETIHKLSESIVAAQKPIRILDAIKWDNEIKRVFFKNKFKKLPAVDEDYYRKHPLTYDPHLKMEEFYDIEREIRRQLGQFSGVGQIMQRMCHEYREVVRMILARGTSDFPKISLDLYGSAEDVFHAGAPSIKDLAELLTTTITNIKDSLITELDEKKYSSQEVVTILSKKLSTFFTDPNQPVRVKLSDGIIADASAGAESIKIRKHARFSERDLKTLEVHEGWVHVGTTLNGLSQPICTFLSKGPPSSTVTQEGLAVITEIFTFASYPGRLGRVTDRINGIYLAETGADFIEVFNYFREHGHHAEDSYRLAARVFRGCSPTKGPFCKDLAYSKGFILIYNYIRLAVQRGLLSRIPLLFVGKTSLEDIRILEDLLNEGIILPPKYLPPQFQDLAGLSAWMCYSLFLNKISLDRLTQDYRDIL
jgi:uncharacterized protein (TIGR02421 family)